LADATNAVIYAGEGDLGGAVQSGIATLPFLGWLGIAGKWGKRASGLGDLNNAEVKMIQNVVDEAGRPLEVVGSAATGTRRGVGTDIPIGKGPGTRSDIRLVVMGEFRHNILISQTLAVSRGGLLIWEREATNL